MFSGRRPPRHGRRAAAALRNDDGRLPEHVLVAHRHQARFYVFVRADVNRRREARPAVKIRARPVRSVGGGAERPQGLRLKVRRAHARVGDGGEKTKDQGHRRRLARQALRREKPARGEAPAAGGVPGRGGPALRRCVRRPPPRRRALGRGRSIAASAQERIELAARRRGAVRYDDRKFVGGHDSDDRRALAFAVVPDRRGPARGGRAAGPRRRRRRRRGGAGALG
mmetsp:Transcript_23350/g.70062  ORF Transcript_23350/g.70062 Transcript_23350/m.70062 type:complete len:226 (-) Transcript_23350:77-754(-)